MCLCFISHLACVSRTGHFFMTSFPQLDTKMPVMVMMMLQIMTFPTHTTTVMTDTYMDTLHHNGALKAHLCWWKLNGILLNLKQLSNWAMYIRKNKIWRATKKVSFNKNYPFFRVYIFPFQFIRYHIFWMSSELMFWVNIDLHRWHYDTKESW